jgi:sugar O-acyltransferase (sialic acid O-acetyltransferase NeuD family)
MKKVYILGAGGFGREVFQWMMETLDFQKDYLFKGFIDDDPNALNSFDIDYGIVSSVREYSYQEGDVLICGLGHPEVKRTICEPLLKAGANFLTIIHPTAKVGRGCSIGVGCVICPFAILTCDVQLGDFVLFNVMSTAGHDVQVGDWSTLSAHSDCTGGVELSESVFLGSGARIIPNKKVGRSATVGAGAVVIRDVPSEDTVFGNPARSIN